MPLLTSHTWMVPDHLVAALLAFIAYSMVAASVYLVNDMLDVQADRRHPHKHTRPIASGQVPFAHAGLLSAMLLLCGMSIAATISQAFLLLILGYLAISNAYSFFLKRIILVDALCLAFLYTLRVISGAVAINVPLSFWMLAFSVFIFYSLALAKRSAELSASQHAEGALPGRGYVMTDGDFVDRLGMNSGLLSVLVFALFINSEAVAVQYGQPEMLWGLCPLLLGWVSYFWLKTDRGQMHHDPVVFALTDRISMLVVAAGVVVVLLAT
ncbi:MAG: UbiA family prenyltransferase [Rhodospirillales bacterium]|nr:UbiA family prenyltransferase [Rhodospirillales bacterium]